MGRLGQSPQSAQTDRAVAGSFREQGSLQFPGTPFSAWRSSLGFVISAVSGACLVRQGWAWRLPADPPR